MKKITKHIIFAVAFLLMAAVVAVGENSSGGVQTAQNEVGRASRPAESQRANRAEEVTKALAAAYPDRIAKAEYRGGDWAVLVSGTWYYYAEGRFLPESLRRTAETYRPIAFYNYPRELPPWVAPSAEESSRFREMHRTRTARASKRSPHFFDALYRAHNSEESYERVKSLRFLGIPVMVHYSILEDLSLVEERILAAAKTDASVREWIRSIDKISGWNWRNIAETESRSFHAYGAAIDIQPRSLGGKEVYWLWAKKEWWNIPYEGRHHPPDAVIKAFESCGFVWGGKWRSFDTIHFEYRPEVFILNGIDLIPAK
jgi:hypothetical protein